MQSSVPTTSPENQQTIAEVDDAVSPRTAEPPNPINLYSMEVFFVLGAPGSGKGTLCPLLATQLNGYHLSVGDHLRMLVRDENASPAALGGWTRQQVQKSMDLRYLLPASIIVNIIRHELHRLGKDGFRLVILDGFPRDLTSAKLFEEELENPSQVLDFRCPRNIALQRFLARRRQTDDTIAVFDQRYDEFAMYNPPILAQYSRLPGKVKTLFTGTSLEAVREVLLHQFENYYDAAQLRDAVFPRTGGTGWSDEAVEEMQASTHALDVEGAAGVSGVSDVPSLTDGPSAEDDSLS